MGFGLGRLLRAVVALSGALAEVFLPAHEAVINRFEGRDRAEDEKDENLGAAPLRSACS